tara:strand:+ start:2584 stop:3099 length:516 start_codon:yes stop_codon:yes gene_type:complete
MSYKNQAQIDTVNDLISKLAIGEYLNASNIALRECTMFLGTHRDCGFHITNPLRAQQAKLINEALVENLSCEYDNCNVVKICPSEITSGMLITQHGYTGKVIRVDRYESFNCGVINEVEPFVYCVCMEYISGDLSMHKYFISAINNGCDKGYLSVQQGNRLANFNRVLIEG